MKAGTALDSGTRRHLIIIGSVNRQLPDADVGDLDPVSDRALQRVFVNSPQRQVGGILNDELRTSRPEPGLRDVCLVVGVPDLDNHVIDFHFRRGSDGIRNGELLTLTIDRVRRVVFIERLRVLGHEVLSELQFDLVCVLLLAFSGNDLIRVILRDFEGWRVAGGALLEEPKVLILVDVPLGFSALGKVGQRISDRREADKPVFTSDSRAISHSGSRNIFSG